MTDKNEVGGDNPTFTEAANRFAERLDGLGSVPNLKTRLQGRTLKALAPYLDADLPADPSPSAVELYQARLAAWMDITAPVKQ